jgi:hypothetical protein
VTNDKTEEADRGFGIAIHHNEVIRQMAASSGHLSRSGVADSGRDDLYCGWLIAPPMRKEW